MIKFRKLSTCFFKLFEAVGKMQLRQAVVNEEQPVVKKKDRNYVISRVAALKIFFILLELSKVNKGHRSSIFK